jgi:hypothetical protein
MSKKIKEEIIEEEGLVEFKEEIKRLGISEEEIISQCQKEYEVSYEFMRPKIEELLLRLTVYNNQKRDKTKVGDPLLFTVFQTLFASLYDDSLNIEFGPREIGDDEVAENLNLTSQFDYSEMKKNLLDFEWSWDTLFCGNGMLLINEFNRKDMHPVPEVLDPCTTLRDSRAVAFNGDSKGNNSARFWGREISATKWELEDNPNYFNLNELKTGKTLKSLLLKAKEKRRSSQGLSDVSNKEDELKENAEYNLLEWWTHLKGKKYLVVLGNSQTKIVRLQRLNSNVWPAINRKLFPIAHDWDGVSVPDLIEDKQRARAILQNLGLKSAKADVEPMYLFSEDRIKNTSDLDFGFNKFIRVQGQGNVGEAIQPMNKPVIHQQVSWIMDLLDQSAQRALATPEIQQGIVSKQARTLGELELVTAKVDTRYSLSAKIFGWSEAEFWQKWYLLYKTHFKDKIDEKMIRLAGVWGPEVRKFKRDNLIAEVDPDILIESKIIAEAKRIKKRNAFTGYYGIIVNNPDANRRFADKELAKLNGLTTQQIRVLFPENLDEIEANMENELINKGKKARVEIDQDHQTHIIIHLRLNNDKKTEEHIKMHQKAMYLLRKNKQLLVQNQRQPIQMPSETIPNQGASAEQPAQQNLQSTQKTNEPILK